MACQCIEMTNAALEPDNLILDTATWFSRETSAYRTTVRIRTDLLGKKRGQRASTMIPEFCPFCGVRYATAEPGTARQEGGDE
jgi:hypothetical protein